MNPDLLCMGCMTDTNAAEVCPRCGYSDRRPAESSVQLEPRTVLNQRYLLGRVLGQGGFGITYLAYDLESDRKLAIKEYFPAVISTRAQNRLTVTPLSARNRADLEYGLGKFEEEGKALARFKDHRGVVSMLDFFYGNGTAYIVMAYIEGQTLKDHVRVKGGKIPFLDAMAILGLVMIALEDLHKAGILHRDISPDNIYVEATGGVKILDFGATRYAMGEQSRSLSVVLKPGYAPEEQYRSRGRQGPWTDIYALGATFYRTIVGRIPPEAPDRVNLDDLVPPSQLGINIPRKSEVALMKALAVKAENRYQTVNEFRRDVTPPPPPIKIIPTHLSKGIFLPIVFILLLIAFAFRNNDPSAVAVEFCSFVVLYGVMLVLFYCMWKPIQEGHVRTTPAKAVGFALIPIFNLYWAFPVLWGFSKDFNRYINQRSLDVKKLNENLFLVASVAFVLGCLVIPWGGVPASVLILLNACVLLPIVAMICDAVNGLQSPKLRKPPAAKRLSLYCVAGEYQGETVEIGPQPIVIGRNPAVANLVLTSGEISAKHVRVWVDSAGSGVWIEDMHSMNSTFYRQAAPRGNSSDWVRLSDSTLLSAGDRFRLSEDAAEFEVKASE
jgi:serine/threonine protein kinase